jgi:hypothetical protein
VHRGLEIPLLYTPPATTELPGAEAYGRDVKVCLPESRVTHEPLSKILARPQCSAFIWVVWAQGSGEPEADEWSL